MPRPVTWWQFQTGQAGGGPAASYEIDGERHIATALRNNVFAFKPVDRFVRFLRWIRRHDPIRRRSSTG
jgi:hypothetical protein